VEYDEERDMLIIRGLPTHCTTSSSAASEPLRRRMGWAHNGG
jgi:hypothetical protein